MGWATFGTFFRELIWSPTLIQVYTLKLPEKLIPHIEKGPAPGE
jgi:hypothetical protein